MRKFIYTLIVSAGFLLPVFFASAETTYHYVCGDFSSGGGTISCTDDVWTFGTTDAYKDDNSSKLPTAGNWYLSFGYSGSGTIHFDWLGTDHYDYSYTGGQHSTLVELPSNITIFELGNNGGTFIGDISSLCLTDTPGACDPVPPPPPTGLFGRGAFDEIFGLATTSASASTTLSIVDNPVQDLFEGFVLFLLTMFGIIWFFKKTRT